MGKNNSHKCRDVLWYLKNQHIINSGDELKSSSTKKYELGAHMTDMIYTRVCALVPWCVCRRYKKHSITIGMLLIILYYFFDYYLLCRLYYYTNRYTYLICVHMFTTMQTTKNRFQPE